MSDIIQLQGQSEDQNIYLLDCNQWKTSYLLDLKEGRYRVMPASTDQPQYDDRRTREDVITTFKILSGSGEAETELL